MDKMKLNIREWDLKSTFLTISFLVIGAFLFFFFTDIRDRFREDDKDKFRGKTDGKIISVEPIERIKQSKWQGTEIFVDSYKIVYSYVVEGQVFKSTDVIPLTMKNKKHLQAILDRKANDSFAVQFDLNDPDKSILIGTEEWGLDSRK